MASSTHTKGAGGKFMRVLYQLILIATFSCIATNVYALFDQDFDMALLLDNFDATHPGLEQAIPHFAEATGGTNITFDVYSSGTTSKLFSTPQKYYKAMSCSDPTKYSEIPRLKRSGSYLMYSVKQDCEVDGALKHGAAIYVAKLANPSQAWLYQYQLGGGTEFITAGFVPDVNNDGINDVVIYRTVGVANGMDIISIVKDAKTGTTISSKQYPFGR